MRLANNRIKTLVIFLLASTLVYIPVLISDYGFSDDYASLASAFQGSFRSVVILPDLQGGRPLYALFNEIAFHSVHSVESLWVLRMFGIFGIGLLAWILHGFLQRSQRNTLVNWVLPTIIIVTPPFQVYAAWASTAFFPYAAAVATAGAIILREKAGRRWTKWAIAATAVFIAASIYQPAAMFFWVITAIDLLLEPRDLHSFVRTFLEDVVVVAVGLSLDFVASKILPSILFSGAPLLGRTTLASHPFEKLSWFLGPPLEDALNIAKIVPSRYVAIVVALLMIVGLLLYLSGQIGDRVTRLMVFLLLLPLAYLPNLIVQLSWPAYRTQAALVSLIVVYVWFGLIGVWRLTRSDPRIPYLAPAVALGLSALAMHNVYVEFVVPQTAEWRFVQAAVTDHRQTVAIRQIDVVPAMWWDTQAPVVRYDEFGFPSAAHSWACEPMVFMALRRYRITVPPSRIVVVFANEIPKNQGGYLIVNFEKS